MLDSVPRVTIDQLLEQAREGLQRVTPPEVAAAMRSGATVIDIRSDAQIAADGTVPGALLIARNVLEWRVDPASDACRPDAPALEDQVIVMCDAGYASSFAAQSLQQLGFASATDLDGGFQAWRAAGLPVTPPAG
jgi:rhodanese-related sulfurtransferase